MTPWPTLTPLTPLRPLTSRWRPWLSLVGLLSLATAAAGEVAPWMRTASSAPAMVQVGPISLRPQASNTPSEGPTTQLRLARGVGAVACTWPTLGQLLLLDSGAHWRPHAGSLTGAAGPLPIVEACDRCRGVPDLRVALGPATLLRLIATAPRQLHALPVVIDGRLIPGGLCAILPAAPEDSDASPP